MIHQIKRVVSEFLSTITLTKYGNITAYNPNNYTVKVMLQPEGIETGFVPLATIWVGNNFGAVFGPNIGDAVKLDFIDGSVQATVVSGRFYNVTALPPQVQSGQAALVDSKGSFIRLNNDGTITMSAPDGITLTTPTLTQNGDLQVNGKVTASGDVTGNGISLDKHVHGGVQSGGSTTATPQG
jgi:phage baseplate assembly protein gpV